jgi:antirestriction protein ArdC
MTHKEVSVYVSLRAPRAAPKRRRSTAETFHGLVHATGHEKRLYRAGVAGSQLAAFGSADYSREGLMVEMGSALS